MPNAGTIAGGLLLICLAGIFNGSWNAAFSPNFNLAVGRKVQSQSDDDHDDDDDDDNKNNNNNNNNSSTTNNDPTSPVNDLAYHHSFALFQIYAALINIPICIAWAGGAARVGAILANTPASSIALVALFSVIWGVGVSSKQSQ